MEKYYTPEQLEELTERRRALGEEGMRQAEAEWSRLIEEVPTKMEAGTDPASEWVQLLARRWMKLVRSFTGGNPEIERSLGNMWQQETEIHGMQSRQMREVG